MMTLRKLQKGHVQEAPWTRPRLPSGSLRVPALLPLPPSGVGKGPFRRLTVLFRPAI